jgi:hypothetical protein
LVRVHDPSPWTKDGHHVAFSDPGKKPKTQRPWAPCRTIYTSVTEVGKDKPEGKKEKEKEITNNKIKK